MFISSLMKNGKQSWSELWNHLKQIHDFIDYRFYLVSTSNLAVKLISKENLREI